MMVCGVIALCLGIPGATRADVRRTPILPNMTLDKPPTIGEPIRATFSVTAERDFSTVDIEFFIPEGVEWLQGEKRYHTTMKKGDRRYFTATVKIIPQFWHALQGGSYQGRFIYAVATATIAEETQWRVWSSAMANGFIERGESNPMDNWEEFFSPKEFREPLPENHYYNYWGPGDGYHYDEVEVKEIEEMEEIRKSLNLPNELNFRGIAMHLWAWEVKDLTNRGHRKEEAFRIIEEFGEEIAKKRGITSEEGIKILVKENLYQEMMERKEGRPYRPFWSPPDRGDTNRRGSIDDSGVDEGAEGKTVVYDSILIAMPIRGDWFYDEHSYSRFVKYSNDYQLR